LAPAIPVARFKLLPLYDALNSVASWKSCTTVRLTNAGYRALRFFWTCLKVADCKQSWEPTEPNELIFTDSSDFGLGAHLEHVNLIRLYRVCGLVLTHNNTSLLKS
jgi:hypothetical protein